MLIDILTKVAAYEGAKDLDLNPQDRTYLLEVINQAAEEIYDGNELPGSLRECYVRVMANKQIALPPFIGKVRAIREYAIKWPWTLNDMRPRYHYEPWKNMWMNWRFIGYSPVCIDISNSAPFTYAILAADSDLYIDIVGSTLTAARTSDRVTMSAASVIGTKSFNNVIAIKANKLPASDITITDADSNVLAILYNDRQETQYAWFDVSEYPSIGDCSDGRFIMEVLYKLPLSKLFNDTDTFPVPGYDLLIADKAIQILLERQDGKEEKAMLAHQKIESRLRDKMENEGATHTKQFKIEPNKMLGMFRAYGYYRGRRMSKL